MSPTSTIGSKRAAEVLARCKRKVPYPIRSMAEKAARITFEEEGVQLDTYVCEYCGKFHNGNPPKDAKQKREAKIIMGKKFMIEFEGVHLIKVKTLEMQYIFAVPADILETENEVLERGVLVATRIGTEMWLEHEGERAKHWRIYNEMLPMYVKELVRFKERVELHETNMIPYHRVQMDVYNGLPLKSLAERTTVPRRIMVQPPAVSKDTPPPPPVEQEMHKGRAVFRTDAGKPYYRDIYTCCSDGCSEQIEVRGYICNPEGRLTTPLTKTPVDKRVIRKAGGRQEWICGTCVDRMNGVIPSEPVEIQGVEQGPAPIALPAPATATPAFIMSELQRICLDPTIDDGFARGASIMSCYLLTGA